MAGYSANSGSGGGGFFSNLGERLKNSVVSGAFWTDAEKDAWGRGLQIAIANGTDADYMRQHPFGTALKDAAFMVATPEAFVAKGALVSKIERKLAKETEQLAKDAQSVAHELNGSKTRVTIKEEDKWTHYDLAGAAHKGVETPHVQYSFPNINPNTGQVLFNKNKELVRPMTRGDLDLVIKYLKD